MKFYLRSTVLSSSAALLLLLITGALSFSAVGQQQGAAGKRQEKPNIAPDLTLGLVPREKREQAYAKLLEGQRYLVGGGLTDATLKLALQAFQQATILDPSLAEAYNGLADIAFYYRSDFDEAERQATAALRADRNSYGAHRVLSRIYTFKSGLRENNLDKAMAEKAIAELREVVRLNSADAEGYALLGDIYLAINRPADAITAYKSWEAAPAPLDTRVYQIITQGRELTPEAAAARLSEAYLRANRPAEAYAAINRAIARNEDSDANLDLLYETIVAGGADEAGALPNLQRLARSKPESAAAQILLARVQARAGKTDEALATLRSAIARKAGGQQSAPQLHKDLAEVLSNSLRYTEAIAAYEDVLKDQGVSGAETPLGAGQERENVAETLKEIVRLQKQAGRSSDAMATIERTRKLLGRDDATADVQYVELLRDQGKKREALQATREALIKYPDQPELIWLQAATLTDLGRVDEASTLLRAKLKNTIEDFNKYISLSALYSQVGRGSEAVEAARKAIALVPDDNPTLTAYGLMVLSTAQEKAGDPKGAEESLRRVLAKDPDNHEALNNLGYFLLERNERLTEALNLIERAVHAKPYNSSYLDSLGWAYFKLGQLDQAERYLSESARRDANSATAQEHLGDLYQKRGKLEQARNAWQKALSLSVETSETNRLRAKLNTARR